MKTGILGGTFNPIHNSHLYVAEEFRRRLGLDRVILMPTFTPPHKLAKDLAPARDRLVMCRLAAAEREGMLVSDYEVSRPEKSYTFSTLEHLGQQMPGDTLYFLMGADMFLTVQDWRNPDRIYRAAILCAAAREPGEYGLLLAHKGLLEAGGARCLVEEIPPKPLSSTLIRNAVAQGQNIADMVPEAVAEYISGHNLYRENANA